MHFGRHYVNICIVPTPILCQPDVGTPPAAPSVELEAGPGVILLETGGKILLE